MMWVYNNIILFVLNLIVVQNTDGSTLEFGEGLEFARTRIDTYKALGSASYLALSSSDPVLAAFRLSHEADKAAYTDPIFRVCITRRVEEDNPCHKKDKTI